MYSGWSALQRIIVMGDETHMVALRLAAQEIVAKNDETPRSEKVRIMVLSDFDFAEELASELADPRDGHAGTIETARMMAIRPDLIKAEGKADVWRIPRFEVLAHPELFFQSGVNGDPTAASAGKGQKINEYIISEVEKLVKTLEQ
jgi:creatinine amidohydrolase